MPACFKCLWGQRLGGQHGGWVVGHYEALQRLLCAHACLDDPGGCQPARTERAGSSARFPQLVGSAVASHLHVWHHGNYAAVLPVLQEGNSETRAMGTAGAS